MSRHGSSRPLVAGLAALALVGYASSLAAPAASAAPPKPALASLSSPGNLISSLTSATDPLDVMSFAVHEAADFEIGALGSSVLGAASAALRETAKIIDSATTPRLESTWFSSVYWRVAALASLLTLPFLFAAAVQALLRSDLALLARAAFAHLPLALIGVSIAAPITMLLLSATDEMCSLVARTGAAGGANFLARTAVQITAVSVLGSPFLGIAIGLLILALALALALEMLIREAAVYVVMLMLPLAFAALVWPARRIWTVRVIELLVSLILSKFVIVAVLSLAGAAYGSSSRPSVTRELTAIALLMLSTLSPWVMLRLLPFTELAAGAAGSIRAELPRASELPRRAGELSDLAETLSPRMRRQAVAADPSNVADNGAGPLGRLGPNASDRAGDDDAGESDPGRPTEPPADSGASSGAGASLDPSAPSGPGAHSEPSPAAAPPRERLPGMEPIYQQPDQSVRINLGRGGYGGAAGPLPDADAGPPWPSGDDPPLSCGADQPLSPGAEQSLSPGTEQSLSPGADQPLSSGGDQPLPSGGDQPLLGPDAGPEPR